MSERFEKLGYSTHLEAAAVFLGFGTLIGFVGGSVEGFGGDPRPILRLAEEGIALGVFYLMCISGLFGLLLASWRRLPRLLSCFLKWSCPSILRSGLTTGFIAAGVTLGLGLGALLPFFVVGTPDQQTSALRLVLLGFVIFLIWWPFYYMAAEVLEVRSKTLNCLAGLYVAMIGLLFVVSDMSAFWWYSALVALACLVGAVIRFRRFLATTREHAPINQ